MPSDPDAPRRLHPATIFFELIDYIRSFGLPAVLLLFGYARGDDEAWRLWSAVLAVPALFGAFASYLMFSYTYGRDELIVRSGVLFRKERHVPYSRIQNIDASQTLLQSVFGVYSLSLESGSGAEPEATFDVLPDEALAEMRRRVFAGRAVEPRAAAADVVPTEAAAAAVPSRELLALGLRDLALCGFIRGRGLLMLALIFGYVSQYMGSDKVVDPVSGDKVAGPLQQMFERIFEQGLDVSQIVIGLILFALAVMVLRVLSILRTIQMFYRFRLTLAGSDLRLAFGLFTRVRATIPLRRIQTLTIREGALHRLFGVTSVRAATAGGGPMGIGGGSRYLAPILPRAELAPLIGVLLPGVDPAAFTWTPAHPRAARRLFVRYAIRSLLISAALWLAAGYWALFPAGALMIFSAVNARLHARHMAHGVCPGFVAYRSGWFMRQTTITPVGKVQAVGLTASPFDRRHRMATVVIDTASANNAPHRLRLRYLDEAAAATFAASLAAGAAGSALNW